MVNLKLHLCMQSNIKFFAENMTCYWKYFIKLGTVLDMLSICEKDCELRDLTIGKNNGFIRLFSELDEMRPAYGLTLDGAVITEIVYYNLGDNNIIIIYVWYNVYR